jgi:hypothetical protein
MTIDKLALLAALKPKTTQTDVDGFGSVGVVQLTVGEVDALRASLKKEDKIDQFGIRLALVSVVDEDGVRVFGEDDLPALMAASNSAMDVLVSKALEVNGFKKAAEAKN